MSNNQPTISCFYSLILVGVCALGLVGCSGYRIRSLQPLHKATADYKGTLRGVKVYVARMEKKAVIAALGDSVPQQVVPLHLTVRNDSSYTVMVSRRHISLPSLTLQELLRVTQRSVMGPMLAGTGIAAVADAATSSSHDHVKRLTGSLVTAAAAMGGMAAAVDNGMQNDDFALNVNEKMLNQETLWPGEEVTKLVFVARVAYREPFTIRLLQSIRGEHHTERRVLPFTVVFPHYAV